MGRRNFSVRANDQLIIELDARNGRISYAGMFFYESLVGIILTDIEISFFPGFG